MIKVTATFKSGEAAKPVKWVNVFLAELFVLSFNKKCKCVVPQGVRVQNYGGFAMIEVFREGDYTLTLKHGWQRKRIRIRCTAKTATSLNISFTPPI